MGTKDKRKSFVFYLDWYEAIKDFDDNVKLEIYDAIIAEAFDLERKELSTMADVSLRFIKPQLDIDREKWMEIRGKRAESGRLGGVNRAKQNQANQANASKCKQNQANQAVNVLQESKDSMCNTNIRKKEEEEDKSSKNKKEDAVSYKSIMDYYNSKITGRLRKIVGINGKRKEHVRARCGEYGEQSAYTAIDKLCASKFLTGQIKDFCATFDWAFLPTNYPKILEGAYDKEETELPDETKDPVQEFYDTHTLEEQAAAFGVEEYLYLELDDTARRMFKERNRSVIVKYLEDHA